MTQQILHGNRWIDLAGRHFGRLIVSETCQIRVIGKSRKRMSYWLCRCECGKSKMIAACHLHSGKIVSCGCLNRERVTKTLVAANFLHGQTNTREFRCWLAMLSRCYGVNRKCYPRYGGRGITVCREWRESFSAFLADMGCAPSSKHSLDRIDNDGNYESGNVRWATSIQQNRNSSSNRMLTYGGQTKTVTEWAELMGINRRTLFGRLDRGWPADRALNERVHS